MEIYGHIGSIGAEGRKSVWMVAIRTPFFNKVVGRFATRQEALDYVAHFMEGHAN